MERSTNPKRLLAVLAHPDDETFGMGGTLAMYAKRGVETYLVCATRGEAGEIDPKFPCAFDSIAECREHELACAAKLLGLKEVYFLNYRDSGMPGSPDNSHPNALVGQPVEKVAAEITHYIRLIQPQVVLTFDPIGGYRHPDHIAIHNATNLGFQFAGNENAFPDDLPAYTPKKLFYHTISHTFIRMGVLLLRLSGKDPSKWGRNGDIDLTSIAAVSFPTHARINYLPVADVRAQASVCHASQGGAQMAKGVMGWMMRLFSSNETFMQAYPPLTSRRISRDLFEAI